MGMKEECLGMKKLPRKKKNGKKKEKYNSTSLFMINTTNLGELSGCRFLRDE